MDHNELIQRMKEKAGLVQGAVVSTFGEVTKAMVDLEDIDRMVKVARKELRPAVLAADMGISGASLVIAETGTLGLISNEGNAWLTTTLPRVHVALVGLEKLVPDLSAALRIIKVLLRPAGMKTSAADSGDPTRWNFPRFQPRFWVRNWIMLKKPAPMFW